MESTRLVADLTGAVPDFASDPYRLFGELRENGPVHRAKVLDGRECWLITGYEVAKAAFTDPRLSNDPQFLKAWDGLGRNVIGRTLMMTDPPDHTRLRKLVAREFTHRRVQSMRPRVQQLTDELLDTMLKGERADLVDAFAFPLPLSVICELLGVPDADRADFRLWSADLSAPATMAAGAAAEAAMTGYLSDLIGRKRLLGGEDLLSALVRTTDEDGDTLSHDELLGMAFLLLVGGHESTAHMIASGTLALLRHPAELAALRADFSLLDSAIEEVLRFDGPVEIAALRYTTEPVILAGTEIPAGEVVLIGLSPAARDHRQFPEPDRFDIRRGLRETRAHFAFGHGVHFCLGAPLARMEGSVALRTLLERCPRLALDTPESALEWNPPTFFMRGLKQLPVTW
ncbi:cytochrome P450 [Streptomyces sp. NPDC051561]|uniref:cytochrome P450 n=1 Tax=Streptomyces sp. NPDC051561 TaxID=3365658 RepID=UPI0037962A5F